jgi:hypothetical protein
MSGQLHDPSELPPGEIAPGTQCVGGWVGLRAGVRTIWNATPAPQPVARRYTDSAIPTVLLCILSLQ